MDFQFELAVSRQQIGTCSNLLYKYIWVYVPRFSVMFVFHVCYG